MRITRQKRRWQAESPKNPAEDTRNAAPAIDPANEADELTVRVPREASGSNYLLRSAGVCW